MHNTQNQNPLNNAVAMLSTALLDNKEISFLDAANAFLKTYENGTISRKFESVILLYSAFCYEISGDLVRSRKPYHQLSKSAILPFDESILTREILLLFNEFVLHFGLREIKQAVLLGESIFFKIKSIQKNDSIFAKDEDQVIIFLGIIETMLSYLEIVSEENKKMLSELASSLESLKTKISDSDSLPWLSLLAKLTCLAIEFAIRRNILNLSLPKPIQAQLILDGKIELWKSQEIAIEKGILNKKNLLLSMPTASGKSFLSTILASYSTKNEKTVFIAPTRTLVKEFYDKLSRMLADSNIRPVITTREKSDFDDKLSDCDVIVATFEKFSSLLKRKLVQKNEIKTLVVDEAHFISDSERGIPLEFLITDLKNHSDVRPQVLALSGMINEEDAKNLSAWIGGEAVQNNWRPVDLDEMVLCNGKLYHKNGTIEPIKIGAAKTLRPESRRLSLVEQLTRSEILEDRQCMIVLHSRTKVEEMSRRITDSIKSFQSLFSPTAADVVDHRRKFYADQIRNIEPELPPYATGLSKMIEAGVGYHHAGLPEIYRDIVERATRSGAIKILVSTSTMEAGVNLPISTVIFPTPSSGRGQYSRMTLNQYKNLSGRAGRPGYDSKGRSILIALEEEEKDDLIEKFLRRESDEVRSGIRYFLNNVPASRYAIQSEILNILSKEGPLLKNEISSKVQDIWFLRSAEKDQIMKFYQYFDREVWKLECYGCVSKKNDKISIDKLGHMANNSMLYAFSVANIITNLVRVVSGKYNRSQFDILILSLVGLAYELRTHDDLVNKVRIAPEVRFVSDVIQYDKKLGETYNRVELAPKFGTLLWYWINSIPTTEIIKKCGFEESHSAFIEETLKEDAYWVLSTVSKLADKKFGINEEIKSRILELAEFCKIGSSDYIVKKLLELELEHMRRGTAIKLANYIREKKKPLIKITKEEFLRIFPQNEPAAVILFAEIHSANRVIET